MPKVTLTYQDVVKGKVKKLKVQCLGVKTMRKLSWGDIADEMFIAKSTLIYRFNNDLFTLSEWLEFLHILGIEKEEIDL